MKKVIKLAGRIDSTNIKDIEEKINTKLYNYNGDIILDLNNLEYISRSGLKIILNIKKKCNIIKIINCSSEIYKIFELSGFTKTFEIRKAYKKISVDDCEVVDEGAYGTIYRIDKETIVKVYKKDYSLENIIKEIENAKIAFILGIPTAISYEIVSVDKSYGSVFEMIDAKTYAKLIKEGESVDLLVRESVNILKHIHNIDNTKYKLVNKKDEVISWAKYCKKYLPKKIGEKLIKLIEDIPNMNTVIHGDFHIKNLMKLKNETLLIDMETIAVGHPIFDFACSYCIYEGFECLDPKNPEKFLGIARKQCREFFELTLEYYFDNLSKKEINQIKKMIKIICYTRLLRRQIKKFGLKNKDAIHSIEYCKKYLIDNVDSIDKLYY